MIYYNSFKFFKCFYTPSIFIYNLINIHNFFFNSFREKEGIITIFNTYIIPYNILVCWICQFCYSGTSSKLFDLSRNCVLESTELILPIPNISWNIRIRIQGLFDLLCSDILELCSRILLFMYLLRP